MSPLLALNGHARRVAQCPLSGAKRTWIDDRPDQLRNELATVSLEGPTVARLYAKRQTQPATRRSGKLGQLQIQRENLYCCPVAVVFADGFFSFLSPISSNPTYTT